MAEAKKESAGEFRPPPTHCLHSSFAHPVLKEWNGEALLTRASLVYPIFVTDAPGTKQEIGSMPGQFRWGADKLRELIEPLVNKGLRAVLLFGVITDPQRKDGKGSWATELDTPVAKALRFLRTHFPQLLLVTDVCLCAYTDHGHCGICRADGSIENQLSIDRLAEMAVFHAQCGAHVVAPSDMMDGRVGAIKAALGKAGFGSRVAVLSYAAKFASVFYGPFRDAASSGMKFGDRSLYQLPPASRSLALRAIDRDVAEGADMVMVKPGGPYLDLVRDCKERVRVPVAVYQVSGEFAMLYHGAAAGAFNLQAAVLESLRGMRRAGADIIITYFAPQVLEWLAA